uniref:phosphoenolpyruvate carboxylase n=1 Tax=Thalassiosira pseudonana TaxID=35128 RepID=W8VKT0_THAPS|nr:phosphoenolpyruvate carboxylase 1 [Thalassiosira pseudonana]
MLSNMLAEVVLKENPVVYDYYTRFRKLGMDRAANPDDTAPFEEMKKLAYDINPRDTLGVMKTFSIALNLVNAAEVHHRIRLVRVSELKDDVNHIGPLPMVEDSIRGTMEILLEGDCDDKDKLFERLTTQKCEIVLTAHPTEVNRKTIISKYRKISELLAYMERPDLHPFERAEAVNNLRGIISAIWGADEIRRVKPTVQKEAAGGCAVIESVLWDAVPSYLRKLDAQCRVTLGKKFPVDATPIKFASWIGGDRDGNPNCTPEVTLEVVTRQRLRAAKMFLNDLNMLYSELAISSRFSKELEALAASVKKSDDNREKYRRVIGHLRRRLVRTVKECEAKLHTLTDTSEVQLASAESAFGSLQGWEDVEPIIKSEELMTPLRIMYDSLVETGFELVADGHVSDIIRRVAVFGMTLVPLDIREESTRHTIAIDAITRHLGIGSYKEWDEEARLNWLQSELNNKRPLFRIRDIEDNLLGLDPDNRKTLMVFKVASELDSESLGAYVISQANTASDVLLVMLLQKQFGMTEKNGKLMRVVPLFETLTDLTNSPAQLERLFSITNYLGAINGKQEVMVGYSDSAKDAGRLAACWAQYTAQEAMANVADRYGVELTFFHGKGGTVGRGGNPALYRAILSHPPNTINGRFRVTEQGEMIRQNFGSLEIAERTLDIYTAALLRESFTKRVEPKQEWRDQMERVSEVSCAAYRHTVRDDPRFVPYFRQATPELELGRLNIGSRPAKRNPKGGVDSLRAIPWTFAWAQTRMHLSAWLGVGDGLRSDNEEDMKTLQEMYEQWPWFREIISLISMLVSKTDFSITKNYDDLLVDSNLRSLGDEVRNKLVETRQAVIDVSGATDISGPHVQLMRASSTIRNPYVDSINVVQAEILKVLRSMPEDDSPDLTPELRTIKNCRTDALLLSIKGIAQGMKNSG